MPIKITCPHCKRGMMGPESLAGKKVRCKACQQILTVPNPAADGAAAPPAAPEAPAKTKPAPAAPAKPKPPASAEKARTKPAAAPAAAPPPPPKAEPPPPPPADVEAQAAALFSDDPAATEQAEAQTIDLNCPYCDEAIHFPVAEAGKRAPCPSCKHIIKVPEPVKKDPTDWRKKEVRGPSGAKQPDQPAPEGAWASSAASRVGRDALVEAGIIEEKQKPRTPWQKYRLSVLAAVALILLAVGGWTGYRWWSGRGAERALKQALDYAASPESAKEARQTGQAALETGAGEYYLNRQTADSAKDALQHFGAALSKLQEAPAGIERDLALGDLALAAVELGGEKEEADKGRRLLWIDVQRRFLMPALSAIRDADARREALRAVAVRLLERGQGKMVLTLTPLVYSAADAEKAAALAVVGLELLRAKDQAAAETAADAALDLYKPKDKDKGRPALRPEVVALAMALQKKPPEPGEAEDDARSEHVGKAEGLARQEQWDRARQQADSKEPGEETRFRALVGVAAAAADHSPPEAAVVEAALNAAETKGRDNGELSWAYFRLIRVALRAGQPPDRLEPLAGSIGNRALRGRAQLALFRERLAGAKQVAEETERLGTIEMAGLARPLASEALARHNTRLDSAWAAKVQDWPQPQKAFGALGVALGLQDHSRK